MQKLYVLVHLFFLSVAVHSQTVYTVVPGSNLFVSANTVFTADSFSITPSSNFTLNNVSFSKHSTIINPANNDYVARVYRFSNTIGSFSGSVKITYSDIELNGLNESDLRLNVFNGTIWQSFSNNVNDGIANTVITNALSNVNLNEIALASVGHALPLKWGPVLAYRQQSAVIVEWVTLQENNVKHFDIERSIDGINWTTIINTIAAHNTSSENHYRQTDMDYDARRLYYRIKQTDMDGRYTYSAIATIAAESSSAQLLVYPNPVANSFFITGKSVALIQQVELFTSGGSLVKKWKEAHTNYSIEQLPAGLYKLRIQKTDGTAEYRSIIKK